MGSTELTLAILSAALAAAGVWIALRQLQASDSDLARLARYRTAMALSREHYLDLTDAALEFHAKQLTRSGALSAAASSRELGLIALPEWIPTAPVPLESSRIALRYVQATPPRGPAFDHILPRLRTSGNSLSATMQAEAAERHKLLFDNPTYFLAAANKVGHSLTFEFALGSYFGFIDANKALALEFATAARVVPGGVEVKTSELVVRRAIGAPTELGNFPHYAAVSTVTIVHDPGVPGSATFYILKRSQNLAMSEGLTGVVPGGMLQPNSVHPAAAQGDLSLIRNIEREFGEELLGLDTHQQPGPRLVDYDAESPFREIDNMIQRGVAQLALLGFGLDPLTHVAEFMTAFVVSKQDFEDVFRPGFIDTGSEGMVPTADGWSGLPFPDGIELVLAREPLGACARACLVLARRHATQLLQSASPVVDGIADGD